MKNITILSFLISTLFLAGCDGNKKENNTQKEQSFPPTSVGYTELHKQVIPVYSELSGRTVAHLNADIRPQISGIILKRLFKEGQNVKEGDVLYEIDPSSYQATYNQAKSNVLKAQATVKAAQAKFARYNQLVKSYSVSKQDYDDIKASYYESQAELLASQSTLKSAQIDLDRTKIRAPISGQIGISTVTPGSLVTANQTDALSTIRSIDDMYVDFTQSSVEQLKLKKYLLKNHETMSSTPVSLTLEDGTQYSEKGTLATSEVSVDQSTGSVTLRADFNNPDHILLPGMYVRVSLSQEKVDGFLAPQQGVVTTPQGTHEIYVINDKNEVNVKNVNVLFAVGNKWALSDQGIKDGDKIILEGIGKVQEGAKVSGQLLTSKEGE